MAGPLKRTTNLTGLPVAKNARQALIYLYNQVLTALNDLPHDAGYRRHTETLTKNRLNIVESESNTDTIEKKINSGQVEELIVQAEREIELVKRMKEWEAWQPLAEDAPPGQWKWP